MLQHYYYTDQYEIMWVFLFSDPIKTCATKKTCMEVNLAPNEIIKNSYLPIGWSDKNNI